MQKPKFYNITPAKGQALLNYQGRLLPSQKIGMQLFETDTVEEVRQKAKQTKLEERQKELNADFKNLLLHGDCLSACAYLKSKNIKVDLVYIDPPFASGANYAKKVYLRNGNKTEFENDDNSIGEEIMYGDIWQKEDYLNWFYERLLAIREVMSESASIYVHLDWHIGHYAKVMLDEVFGEENFEREIIWSKGNVSGFKGKAINWIQSHDNIYFYTKNQDKVFKKQYNKYSKEYLDKFDKTDKDGRRYWQWSSTKRRYLDELKGLPVSDVWDIKYENNMSQNRTDYNTQKPEEILIKIINASTDDHMIVADFFSGSGTTAKVSYELDRKFISCDIGINAIQTTRDRLAKAGAELDIVKIRDGVRLFRNPVQTTQKIFSLIDGFRSRVELGLGEFWDGGIISVKGSFVPVKFIGIDKKLTKVLLDVILEEIYQLEGNESGASKVKIIYTYKDLDIDQGYLNNQIRKSGKTMIKVELLSLDDLLADKSDMLFTEDNANIEIKKQGNKTIVKIKKYFSPYLKTKIDEYNAKRVKKGTLEEDKSKAVKISDNGLELIEAVQFDTELKKSGTWTSNLELEDKAEIKDKIKGVYELSTDKFRIKVRNIAGDEIIIDYSK